MLFFSEGKNVKSAKLRSRALTVTNQIMIQLCNISGENINCELLFFSSSSGINWTAIWAEIESLSVKTILCGHFDMIEGKTIFISS